MKFIGREGDSLEWLGAFRRPQGLDIDQEGHILVTDSRNDRVQVGHTFFGHPSVDRNAITYCR